MAVTMCLIWSSRTVFTGFRCSNITSAIPKCSIMSNVPTVSEATNATETLVRQKFRQLMDWYEEFTGLKDVRLAQEKVLKAEDHFRAVQETRRNINKQLATVQDRLKEIYSELDQTTRGEDRYVLLITQEHKVLKEERKLVEHFNQCEQEERENFSHLSNAVKASHEKERIQAERTKYWSIIGSVIGTVLGVAGSSINNEFKMKELRKLVRDSAQANLSSHYDGGTLHEMVAVSKELKELVQNSAQGSTTLDVLNNLQEQSAVIAQQVQELQKTLIDIPHTSTQGTKTNLDQLLEAQRRENRMFAIALLVSSASLLVLFSLKT